jgi:hypothetical protein
VQCSTNYGLRVYKPWFEKDWSRRSTLFRIHLATEICVNKEKKVRAQLVKPFSLHLFTLLCLIDLLFLFYFILLLQITFYVRTDSVHGKRVGPNLKVSLCRGHARSWLQAALCKCVIYHPQNFTDPA